MNPYLAPGIMTIDDVVCDAYGLQKEDLQKKSRDRDIVTARQIAMWYRHLVLNESQSVAGKPFDKDHATVIYTCKTVRDLWQTDYTYRLTLQLIIEELHPFATLYVDEEEKLRIRTI